MWFFNKRLISKSDEIRLIKAIQLAELKTSGEVRVHLAKRCKTDALTECKFYFKKLNMHLTKGQNGILLYLSADSKAFAVWGGQGIHDKVTDAFWENIKNCSIDLFKQDNMIEGLEAAIHECGEQLKTYFPISHNDVNELPNDISY